VIGPQDEEPHAGEGESFGDAVTFAWGDREAGLYGSARIGLTPAAGTVSSLALLFEGRDAVAGHAQGGIEVAGPTFAEIAAGPVRMRTEEPLERWVVAFDSGDGGFELQFSALGPPLELGPEDPAARAGGMQGYEQLCQVEGTVSASGRRHEIRCLGQRGHAWGAPDWEGIERAATLSAWMAPDLALAVETVRPAGDGGPEGEAVSALLLEPAEEGPGVAVRRFGIPRVSTTYDAEGRHRRVGLELWPEAEDDAEEPAPPRRAFGEVLCGTTLDLGRLRMDAAFVGWRMDGLEGVGRYDVLRRA
jgi:hypothetical protein